MQRSGVSETGAAVAAWLSLCSPGALAAWPAGSTPLAPLNFSVAAYARGLDAPRALLTLPNGDVLVSEFHGGRGRVTLLRDTDRDGRADQQFVLVDSDQPLEDLALRRDRLYVADGEGILGCPFLVGQTRLHGTCRRLRPATAAGTDERWRHSLQLNSDETGLLSSEGRDGSGDAAAPAAEPRTLIELVRPDTGAARELGSLEGNALALAIEPRTGLLWVAVGRAGSTGAEPAPDTLAAFATATKGGHAPIALGVRAAPRGLTFYQRQQFPKLYRGAAFIALHGQADDASAHGAKVVFVPFENGWPAGSAQEFLTGFGSDADQPANGRPAALAVGNDGSLLVADDAGSTVWRVVFKCAACTADPVPATRARSAGRR